MTRCSLHPDDFDNNTISISLLGWNPAIFSISIFSIFSILLRSQNRKICRRPTQSCNACSSFHAKICSSLARGPVEQPAHWFLYNWIAHPTEKMKPQNHEFGVPRWPPQDFRLIETIDQTRKAHWIWSSKIASVASKFYWQNILYAWSSII